MVVFLRFDSFALFDSLVDLGESIKLALLLQELLQHFNVDRWSNGKANDLAYFLPQELISNLKLVGQPVVSIYEQLAFVLLHAFSRLIVSTHTLVFFLAGIHFNKLNKKLKLKLKVQLFY